MPYEFQEQLVNFHKASWDSDRDCIEYGDQGAEQFPTDNGSAYDFFTLWWCVRDKRSVKTVL